MAGILDPTDITEFNINGNYFLGTQLGYGGFYLNGLFGKDYAQVDLTGGLDITKDFYLGVNATIADATADMGFSGAALYSQYAFNENLKMGTRLEYFNDKDGNFVFNSNIKNTNALVFTLSANYAIGGLTIIPEARMDILSEDFFTDRDGSDSNNLSSFVLAFVYGF